jgi:hypothetical protein
MKLDKVLDIESEQTSEVAKKRTRTYFLQRLPQHKRGAKRPLTLLAGESQLSKT